VGDSECEGLVDLHHDVVAVWLCRRSGTDFHNTRTAHEQSRGDADDEGRGLALPTFLDSTWGRNHATPVGVDVELAGARIECECAGLVGAIE
jgi:hypothetical protein